VNGTKRIAAAALAAALVGLLAACGEQPGAGVEAQAGGLAIKGAGATFPEPVYKRWMGEFAKERPDLAFGYEGVGSGEGIARFIEGEVDFGASDAAMSDKDLAKVDPKRGAVMVPMTAGMVVLAYHIPGVAKGLVLARDVYVDIFAGKIRKWNDPRILATNKDLKLPDADILPVVRRDSSGTTFAMTNHLAAASPWWKGQGPGVGKLVDWPGGAMAVRGNEGVARRVQITQGSIGYMGYEFAERLGLPMAALQNKAGQAVAPSPESGRAALASVGQVPADLRVFVPDPEGPGAYPIVTYTWILLDAHYADAAKAKALRDALQWGLGKGQPIAAAMGYVPLPEAMIAKSAEALARIQ
jgi:phosphate transport system substrate-binding protein